MTSSKDVIAKQQAELAEAKHHAELAEARHQAEVAQAKLQVELAQAKIQAELAQVKPPAVSPVTLKPSPPAVSTSSIQNVKGSSSPQASSTDDFKTFQAKMQEARQGDAIAQWNLGFMYQKGYGVPQNYTEALKWFQKSVNQGNAFAQNNLDALKKTIK